MRLEAGALLLALPLLGACVSPIGMAAVRNKPDKVRALLASGVPVNKVSWGATPLHHAADSGSYEAARVLLDAGADVNAVTHLFGTPQTPRELALYRNHTKVAELIATYEPKRNPEPAESSPPAAAPPGNKALSSDVDSPARRGAERPDDFALVIGIEDYQSLPKADYGARDAATARKHFEAMGVPARNIISLEGAQATGSKLKNYLQQWLPRNVKAESTVFVYYSGHGAPDPESGDAYLVPWDADPMFLTTSAYPLKQFYAELSRLKAKRVLVALDACFSGSGGRSVLAKGARPLVSKVDESVPSAANLTVIAAASGSEITGTLDEQGHGMFTYHFLKGLSGGAKTPRALHDYLKPRVQDDARRQNREQSPTLTGSGAEDSF